jgi:class 3 adenylate cyclase/TolB-like protein/Flp pilus assembly protein TadD
MTSPPLTSTNTAEGSGHQLLSVGVLAADLVGYSELIFDDPQQAIAVLRDSRKVLLDAIRAHGGSIMQTPGDFVLATFPQPDRLLPGALEAQARLLEHHRSGKSARDGHWKIGLEFGEVHLVEGDCYGTAINIAARLQALAAPGEVWFTDAVPRSGVKAGEIEIDELGAKQLKNIRHPVRVFRARLAGYPKPAPVQRRADLPTFEGRLQKPVLMLEDFRHVGRGSRARFLGEALIEELKLILSRLSGSLTVIHRADSDHDYVLSGTIQGSGSNFRIVSKLVSARDGLTLWAERFESNLAESFDVQDQLAREIVSALQLTLTEGEQAQLWSRATNSGRAWEAFQRGHDFERRYTREGHARAKEQYLQALSLDGEYLCAAVALGFCHLDEIRLGWSQDDGASLATAEDLYARASAIAADHPDVLALLAYIRFFQDRLDEARSAIDRAVALAPQSPEIIAYQGALFDLLGDFAAAIRAYARAVSLAPHTPAWIASNLGLSLLALDNSFEAERVLREVIRSHPHYARAWIGLTVALVRQGRLGEAAQAAETMLSLDPLFTTADWARSRPFSHPETLSRFIAELRAAGLN